ncbi:MAG: response regulator [Candidatus Omnitrophica bacterium]|nr:response regulator [Candidatus Omnitrophota bacterium]
MAVKKKLCVMVVDDEDSVLNMLGEMVRHTGWDCLTAPTGEIALGLFGKHDVDIVVLDLNLPNMKGFDVLKNMKALKPKVPVVILTGLGYDKEQVDEALKLGASGYVGKAMPVEQTISAIKNVLAKK